MSAQNGQYKTAKSLVDGTVLSAISRFLLTRMKKILLTGLPPNADPVRVKERMEYFGPVIQVSKIVEGDADQPWVIVEMDLDPVRLQEVAQRIDGIYYIDRFITAHVLTYD